MQVLVCWDLDVIFFFEALPLSTCSPFTKGLLRIWKFLCGPSDKSCSFRRVDFILYQIRLLVHVVSTIFSFADIDSLIVFDSTMSFRSLGPVCFLLYLHECYVGYIFLAVFMLSLISPRCWEVVVLRLFGLSCALQFSCLSLLFVIYESLCVRHSLHCDF